MVIAEIADVYPGGNRVYIIDPGAAQVLITESAWYGTIFCATVLVPWAATVYINDKDHKEVEIYINNREVLQVTIVEKGARFLVLQLTGGTIPNGGYSIVPEGTRYPHIFTKVFGPDSYSACDSFIKERASKIFSMLTGEALGFHQVTFDEASIQLSGGEAPHGLNPATEGGGSGNPKGLCIL